MEPTEQKQKEKEDVIVLKISFGNPSNEIIDGELRLSKDKQYLNKTVAMIDIPTEIDLKEIFAFLQKSDSSLKITHIKILNQESQPNNTSISDLPQSFYSILCSFTSTAQVQLFTKDLNNQSYTNSTHKCNIYYLVNGIIIINKPIHSIKNSKQEADEDENECNDTTKQKMNFPPTKITTAHLIKQNSNGPNQNNNDEEEANCGFCLDSVHAQNPFGIDATSPQQSPLKNYNHTPFLSPMHRDNSDGSGQFKLFPHANKFECTPSPPPTEHDEDDLNQRDIIINNNNNNNQEIKWYDNDDTVCFVLCGHFFHVMCLMRCEQNSCPICRHYLFPESTSICNSCNLCTKDLWVCLTCGHVGCGRFSKEKCALKHYQSTSHIWAKCITTSHVWDYADDDYVYRIVMAEVQSSGQTKLVSVQGQNDDGIDGSQKHLPQELDHFSSIKQEEFIYEYNFIVQDKLKRLQIFHESKMKRIKKNGENELNKLDDEITRIQREIESKNKNNAKLLAKYTKNDNDETKVEFVNDIEYLRKQLEEERNRGEKLKKMIHNVFVEQKTFNEKLKEYENTLKQSLSMTESTLNTEISNLQNDLRDYKAHLDTSNKMKKMVDTTDELNGAQVSVRPGKSKNNQKRQGKNKPHSNKKTKKSRKNRK